MFTNYFVTTYMIGDPAFMPVQVHLSTFDSSENIPQIAFLTTFPKLFIL